MIDDGRAFGKYYHHLQPLHTAPEVAKTTGYAYLGLEKNARTYILPVVLETAVFHDVQGETEATTNLRAGDEVTTLTLDRTLLRPRAGLA